MTTRVSRALSVGGIGREADLRGFGTHTGETGSAVHVGGGEQRRGSCRGWVCVCDGIFRTEEVKDAGEEDESCRHVLCRGEGRVQS